MKTTKILIFTLITMMSAPVLKAQTTTNTPESAKKAPLDDEIVIGYVETSKYRGSTEKHYKFNEKQFEPYEKESKRREKFSEWTYSYFEDTKKEYSEEELLQVLQKEAESRYGKQYHNLILRVFKYNYSSRRAMDDLPCCRDYYNYYYDISAKVVVKDQRLPNTIEKALSNLKDGSRIAIDNIIVPNGTNKEDYKDKVVEILLDQGFKVVAKEYLEKLYEEQQNQQSGIYNDRTTVQENNFSAVGYYLNIKHTETSLSVQVINVSTGEYEGNATIKLNNNSSLSAQGNKNPKLSNTIEKALSNLREGSRIAIDQVRVPTGTDKDGYTDEVVEILLDKGYKVVAKEYLEKLYEEQKNQQSGIYNNRTTVQENNFSAVGYYLNIKLTETSLRVQVINVSTGEYEGNVTIKLQE